MKVEVLCCQQLFKFNQLFSLHKLEYIYPQVGMGVAVW